MLPTHPATGAAQDPDNDGVATTWGACYALCYRHEAAHDLVVWVAIAMVVVVCSFGDLSRCMPCVAQQVCVARRATAALLRSALQMVTFKIRKRGGAINVHTFSLARGYHYCTSI